MLVDFFFVVEFDLVVDEAGHHHHHHHQTSQPHFVLGALYSSQVHSLGCEIVNADAADLFALVPQYLWMVAHLKLLHPVQKFVAVAVEESYDVDG